MATSVGSTIAVLDVRSPFLTIVVSDTIVDGAVELIDFRTGWIPSADFITFLDEVDHLSRHPRDKVASTPSRNCFLRSLQDDPLKHSCAGRRGGGALLRRQIGLHKVPELGHIGAPEVGEGGGTRERRGGRRREGEKDWKVVRR